MYSIADMQATKIEEVFQRYNPYLHICRGNIVSGMADAPLGHIFVKYFEHGKMLRALLVLVAASAVGGKPGEVEVAAEALELLHGAALVHDDIIDDAAERRGLPALHVQVGTETALVLGDYLMLRAFAVLARAHAIHPPQRVVEALNTLSRYAQECCRGQVEELFPSAQLDAEEAYLSIVRGKTASQFAAATTVGAILVNATQPKIEALRTYGLNLGVAFQIRDDVLDLISESKVLGKPAGKSLDQGRPMLPLIYMEKFGSMAARTEYIRMRQARCERRELVALLEEEGIFNLVTNAQQRHLNAALIALDELPPSDDVEALRVLAPYSVARHA